MVAMLPPMNPQGSRLFDLATWEPRLRQRLLQEDLGSDPSHDLAHFIRVVEMARFLAGQEGGRLEVVIPAAWLHDLVNVPKNDPRRAQASRLSAEAATAYLRDSGYPADLLPDIAHAIEAHSFSAGIPARTLEAKIVQDADRLDALGAIGVARCFSTGQVMGAAFYEASDPFAKSGRALDDRAYSVDHFAVKLFKIAETLHTESARAEGARRVETMRIFLGALGREIRPEQPWTP